MSTTLYRKYRPQSWGDVAGQEHVKTTLGFEIANGRLAHAYLFSGPRGVGKTTIARIMARALNCQARKGSDPCGECTACVAITEGAALDVMEIDAASHRGIDSVRENVIENARFAPARLAYKVFIIDEVHMLTTEAFNALLKTLEEPPSKTVFILATTELHKVPATIISRCQRFDFRKIPFDSLIGRLEALATRESRSFDRRTLEEIARLADGCLRDAEGLLGKVMAVGDGSAVSYEDALAILPRTDHAALAAFVSALVSRDARTALGVIAEGMENGTDIEQFAGDVIESLRKTLLAKLGGGAGMFGAEIDDARKEQFATWADALDTGRLASMIEILLEKRSEMKRAHPVQLPLELAVVRICADLADTAPASGTTLRGLETDVRESGTRAVAVPARVSQSVPAAAVAAKAAAPVEAEPIVAPAATVISAAAESVAAPVAASTSGEPVTTIQKVKAVWVQFMQKAGEENLALPFLLGVGEPIEIQGSQVRIGFDFAFHKDKMNQEKNRRVLERALGAVLNVVVRVEGVLLEKNREKAHDGDAMMAMSAGLVPAAVPVASDGLAAAFGGRVVE